MNIDLTEEELRLALDMLYMAEWMLNAHKVGNENHHTEYKLVEQKFWAAAHHSGKFDDLVDYDETHDMYWPTRAFEDDLDEKGFINEYDNDTFWDELANRLARRDAVKQSGGIEKFADLSGEERLMRMFGFEEAYNEEFVRYGLERIYIKRSAHRGKKRSAKGKRRR